MTTDAKRKGEAAPLGELLQFNPFAHMSPEQAAAHDARVAAKLGAEAQAEQRERAGQKRRSLLDAGFPLRAVEAAERADESNPVIARVRDWNADVESVLAIAGPKGCGKTVAAAWWAYRQRHPPRFVRAATFAAASRYDREAGDVKAVCLGARALVLDDLGMEFLDAKGSFLVDLDELIDVFYGDKRPLLITTNCTVEKFRERYGERVADRLRECGSFWETSAASMRGKS